MHSRISKLKLILTLFALLLLVLAPTATAFAQSDDGGPVVYALLFYSPECPHCHDFIQNSYPLMQEEFGDQFVMLFINVLDQQNAWLMAGAYDLYQVPEDQRYVPMMFIGDTVLVGSDQIPNEGSQIIRDGLANGGIPLPDIPGLQEAYDEAVAAEAAAAPSGDQAAAEEAAPTAEPDTGVAVDAADVAAAPTIAERFRADLTANLLAVLVLALLVLSVIVVLIGGLANTGWLAGGLPRVAALIAAGLTGGIGISLLLRAQGNLLALLMAGIAVAGALAAAVLLIRAESLEDAPGWLVPLVSVAGLAVAIYLAAVEATQSTAVCGVVGDCNAVQQSPYASLFGIPIGMLGIAGYVLIIAAWVLTQGKGGVARLGHSVLLALTLFGAIFSLYLTFLEPFVIGATCAWCLTSALAMLLLLWLTAPAGMQAVAAPAPASKAKSRRR